MSREEFERLVAAGYLHRSVRPGEGIYLRTDVAYRFRPDLPTLPVQPPAPATGLVRR